MREIIIKNQTNLSDSEAVMRAMLYMIHKKEYAMEGGFDFKTDKTIPSKYVIEIKHKYMEDEIIKKVRRLCIETMQFWVNIMNGVAMLEDILKRGQDWSDDR